jgi:hypothetical protein
MRDGRLIEMLDVGKIPAQVLRERFRQGRWRGGYRR